MDINLLGPWTLVGGMMVGNDLSVFGKGYIGKPVPIHFKCLVQQNIFYMFVF